MIRNLMPLFLATAALSTACGSPEATQDQSSAGDAAADQAIAAAEAAEPDFYSLAAESLDGEPVDLSRYRGKVALVVNVASRCGYTPQYAGLEALYQERKDSGLVVLAFPSNDFGGQEPGSPEEIRQFCTDRFGVDFPMFAKAQTKPGEGQSPVYAMLGEASGQLPKWNFCKYLIGKDGQVLGFYPSDVAPESDELRTAIDAALQ